MLTSFLVIAGTGRPYLGAALESLIRQDTTEWEAVVVEACAKTEDTASVMRQIADVPDPRIRVISWEGPRPPHPYPPCAAAKWNFALKHVVGSLIAFLDDDDMKEPDWLSEMTAPFSNQYLDATVCNGVNIDRNGTRSGATFGHASLDYGDLIQANFVTTGQLLVSRTCIDSIGGFDGELLCSEDYDFCLRFAKDNHVWQHVSTTKCLKRDSGDNACYYSGGWTQPALRRIIAKHGVGDICHSCKNDNTDFVWCVPNLGFRNWHYGCTGLKPGS